MFFKVLGSFHDLHPSIPVHHAISLHEVTKVPTSLVITDPGLTSSSLTDSSKVLDFLVCRLQSLDLMIKKLSWKKGNTVFAVGPSTSTSIFIDYHVLS